MGLKVFAPFSSIGQNPSRLNLTLINRSNKTVLMQYKVIAFEIKVQKDIPKEADFGSQNLKTVSALSVLQNVVLIFPASLQACFVTFQLLEEDTGLLITYPSGKDFYNVDIETYEQRYEFIIGESMYFIVNNFI